MSWYDFSAENPLRPADWRWRRSEFAVDGTMPMSRRRDDRWARRAIAFRARLTRPDLDEDDLYTRDPELLAAYRLWDRRGLKRNDPNAAPHLAQQANDLWMAALSIECRCLGRQGREEIAELASLPVGVVEAYERVFFDVRDRLDCRDWIRNVVLGPKALTATDLQYEHYWRLWSYHGGYVVFDDLRDGVVEIPRPASGAGLQAFWDDAARGASARKATQSLIRANTSDNMTQPWVVQARQKFIDQQHSQAAAGRAGGEGGSGANDETIRQSLALALGGLPWRADGKAPDEVALRKLDEGVAAASAPASGVERRGEELLRLAIVGDLDEAAAAVDGAFADATYPEPVRRVQRDEATGTNGAVEE